MLWDKLNMMLYNFSSYFYGYIRNANEQEKSMFILEASKGIS